jgi:hypothetical protein
MMKAMRSLLRAIALRRGRDASHSKALRAKSLETYHRFAQAFGALARLRVAFRTRARGGDPSRGDGLKATVKGNT